MRESETEATLDQGITPPVLIQVETIQTDHLYTQDLSELFD